MGKEIVKTHFQTPPPTPPPPTLPTNFGQLSNTKNSHPFHPSWRGVDPSCPWITAFGKACVRGFSNGKYWVEFLSEFYFVFSHLFLNVLKTMSGARPSGKRLPSVPKIGVIKTIANKVTLFEVLLLAIHFHTNWENICHGDPKYSIWNKKKIYELIQTKYITIQL